MDVLKAIVNRRSCRAYTQKPVEFDKVTAVIEAGHYAPSAGNLQSWKFIIVTDKGLRESIAEHCMEQYWMGHAPVHIVICANDELAEIKYGIRGKRLYNIQNCAAAVENMLLTSLALGLGSCWVGAFDEDYLASALGIPERCRAQAIITLGYPDLTIKPDKKELTSLQSMVYFNGFGARLEKPHLVLRDFSVEWEQQFNNIKEKAKPTINKGLGKLKESVQQLKAQVQEQREAKGQNQVSEQEQQPLQGEMPVQEQVYEQTPEQEPRISHGYATSVHDETDDIKEEIYIRPKNNHPLTPTEQVDEHRLDDEEDEKPFTYKEKR